MRTVQPVHAPEGSHDIDIKLPDELDLLRVRLLGETGVVEVSRLLLDEVGSGLELVDIALEVKLLIGDSACGGHIEAC